MIDAASLWSLAVGRAETTPNALCVLDEAGRALDFEGFCDAALACAAGLAARGIGAGTRVSWQLPTRIDSLVLCAALSRLGAIQNPILPIYREAEVGFVTREFGAEWLIVPGALRGFDHTAMAEAIAREAPTMQVLDLSAGFPKAGADDLAPILDEAGDPLRWVLYSSGTTADPKGAKHSDGTLLAASAGFSERLQLVPDDRIALVFPVTHVGGILWLMNGLRVGCAQLVVESFDPATTIPFLAENGVTQATAGTVFHQAYLAEQRRHPEKRLFPELRTLPGGGAPKPPQLHFDIRREMGAPIVSGYGLTECPVLTLNGPDDPDEKLAHTEGRPSPEGVSIRIVEFDERTAATGEEGEICVRAPQLFHGYWNADLDATAFDKDGFFRTGDLGSVDAEGFLRVTGRLKDVIIRKGENISSREVEDALFPHPKVAEVAVVGLPDSERGELCCAVVVTETGAAPLGFEEMTRYLIDAGLMRQKIPERLEFVDALPRNPTGKVLKQALRERYTG